VDDDDAIRRLIRLNLSDSYEIIDTGKPEEALALTMEHKPDAILLDLRMPKISGIDLCRTLSACSKTQPVPVFLVSGEPAIDAQRYCKELGAAGHFEKPIDFDALRGCLARLQKQNAVPRSEVRVRLRVHIKIAGVDAHGTDFQEKAYTENVSLSGFLCSCVTAPTDAFADGNFPHGTSGTIRGASPGRPRGNFGRVCHAIWFSVHGEERRVGSRVGSRSWCVSAAFFCR
jgi:CheY-like chemotaxis protein